MFDDIDYYEDRPKGKVKCRTCYWFGLDPIDRCYTERNICGHHGCASIDPDGEQPNLDTRGGCGYRRKNEPKQLTLF